MRQVVFLSIIYTTLLVNYTSGSDKLYSNTWAVEVEGGKNEADRIAQKFGYINLGKIGNSDRIFHFQHKKHPRRSRRSLEDETRLLYEETTVKWADQQVIKKRVKRAYKFQINDPLFRNQWYLHNTRSPYIGFDHNVIPVWTQGVFGKGVVVSILDDGIEKTHSDLAANYDDKASYDYNSNDPDPTPRPTYTNENRHGTRCAGEVAAVHNNSICIAGVAPKARIGGVRMLDGEVTDAVEAKSLSLNPQHIEIYSASWGPDDDGKTVDGPGPLARRAFTEGITEGRNGLGSIYVWASGNGGHYGDNCNCDGYTNSIYTLSISSATEHGGSPWYSESCSSTLATTFSSGSYSMRKIVTTDLDNRCTQSHTGTSASAPIAAGILALALEVNRNLTWRDMQHLVVRTSRMDLLRSHDIVKNGVGHHVSHKFGYGLLDAKNLVELARVWKTVPTQHVCHEIPDVKQWIIPSHGTLLVEKEAKGCKQSNNEVKFIEHVEAVISLDFHRRGDLVISLTSPMGTKSTLLAKRLRDNDERGFTNWAFMTTHCWGEHPDGKWILEIRNEGAPSNNGTLKNWSLRFYGTSEDPSPIHTGKPVPACDIECDKGCRGPGPAQCNDCIHYRRKATRECVTSCTKNEFVQGKECVPCSPTCNACNGPSSTDCLSCLSPLLLINKKCVNLCPPSWFKSQDKCVKCDPRCLTCTGKATECTSCKHSHKLVGSSCQRFCSSGFFRNNKECLACHSSCSDCSKGGPNGCTKCTIGRYIHKGQCLKTCPAGMFESQNNKNCKPCHRSCSACAGPKPNDCLTCKTGLFRVNKTHGLCKMTCPKGYFQDPTKGLCLQCDQSCATCNAKDPSKCTSCADGNYLDNSKCVGPHNCSIQTYPNTSSKRCTNCFRNCKQCSGPATNQCLSCIKGYYIYKSKCVLRCPITTFPSKLRCKECPKHCLLCYSKDKCLSCESSFVLYGSECLSECPKGTFMDHSKKVCLHCHPFCSSCSDSSPDSCLSCKDGYQLNGTRCISKCPNGEVLSNTGCSKCHVSCSSCTGTTDKDCATCSGVKFLNPDTNTCLYQCPDGYFGEVDTAICKACPTGCKTCKEQGKCTVCKEGLVKNGDACEPHCPEGMFVSIGSNTCTKCDSSCLECLEKPDHCIKCHSQRFLNANKCKNICPSGWFHRWLSNNCEKCDSLCVECSGPSANDCTKCALGLLKVGKTCLKNCPSGYFYNTYNEKCSPCDYFCQECNDGNGLQNCSKCIPPFVLHQQYCVQQCPSTGWFLDTKQQKCIKCHSSCSQCIGPTPNHCITCTHPKAVLSGLTCQLQCPRGFFKNAKTRQCQKCHPTCTSCIGIGPAACTSCVDSLILHKDKKSMGKCLSECEPHQFKMKAKCQSCHKSCLSCYGPTNTNCLSCNKGQVYFKNTCRNKCPSGTFLKTKLRRCFSCHPLCKTCTGPLSNQCLSCASTLFLEETTCVIQCSSKTSPNIRKKLCKPCRDCQGQPGKPWNRSIQDPSIQTIKFLLDDPKRNGVLSFAVMSVGLCIVLFLVILGILQMRSTQHLCFNRRYTIIKADLNVDNEDERSLIDGDIDFEEDSL